MPKNNCEEQLRELKSLAESAANLTKKVAAVLESNKKVIKALTALQFKGVKD